jgi:hypothetical protein
LVNFDSSLAMQTPMTLPNIPCAAGWIRRPHLPGDDRTSDERRKCFAALASLTLAILSGLKLARNASRSDLEKGV